MDFVELGNQIIDILSRMGYLGVIGIMAIESTFVPVVIPSEIFLISYGTAAYKGDMSLFLLILSSSLGILIGSLINYYMAAFIGRAALYKYGKYVFLRPGRIKYWEKMFLKYGKSIVFFGRFIPIPAVKHIVSLPAGLSRMNIKVFSFLTTLGGTIFASGVILIGYWFGKKIESIEDFSVFVDKFIMSGIIFLIIPIVIYKLYRRKRRRKSDDELQGV